MKKGETKYNWDDLEKLYVDRKLSSIAIARMKGVEHHTVLRYLRKLGVTIRSLSESQRGIPHPWVVGLSGSKNPMYGRVEQLNPFFGKHHKPEVIEQSRERNRILTKQWWQDPDYREKVLRGVAKASHVHPNKPEQALMSILNKACPNEFEYNGNGKVIILGMVPDFININGKKQVIEVFGDYWHSPEVTQNQSWNRTELGRIMAYNSLGYDCLVIWERDLHSESEQDLISRIKMFSRSKRRCGVRLH